MSRWRPPSTEKASGLITARGLSKLQAEYDEVWHQRRPAVVRALAAAAAEGDRSENAEYQYRKKELREIDRRVRYLQKRLPELRVPPPPDDPSRIYFGALVEIAVDDQAPRQLYLVGRDEAEAGSGQVSIDAPLPRALLGRRVGDVIDFQGPSGAQEIEVLAIQYP